MDILVRSVYCGVLRAGCTALVLRCVVLRGNGCTNQDTWTHTLEEAEKACKKDAASAGCFT
eukprot:3941808-Rhodomonas_salina.1